MYDARVASLAPFGGGGPRPRACARALRVAADVTTPPASLRSLLSDEAHGVGAALARGGVADDRGSQVVRRRSGRSVGGWIAAVSRQPAVPTLLAVALALALWQAAAERALAPAYILPLPAKVFSAWVQLLTTGALARHVTATLSEALVGFAIAFIAGTVLAYPLARSETLARLSSPFIAATQAVPMIALAPLLVMWFGLGLISKVIICALIVFFPILVNTIVGLRSVEPEMTDAARTLGAGAWQTLWYVEVPLALRPVLAGIRMGLTLAMTGAIVGEFVASDAGLGFLMVLSRTNFDAAMVFAASLTIAAISTLLYKSVSWVEQLLIDW